MVPSAGRRSPFCQHLRELGRDIAEVSGLALQSR
jgi:hypothetical protein